MGEIGVVVAFLVLAALAFAGSVRLGMLVGLRLDRTLQASETEGSIEGATEGETEVATETDLGRNSSPGGIPR